MEFENLHDHANWLTSEIEALKARLSGGGSDLEARVTKLEGRVSAADNLARVAMAEIKEHEAETNTLTQPTTEATDGKANDQGTSEAAG